MKISTTIQAIVLAIALAPHAAPAAARPALAERNAAILPAGETAPPDGDDQREAAADDDGPTRLTPGSCQAYWSCIRRCVHIDPEGDDDPPCEDHCDRRWPWCAS